MKLNSLVRYQIWDGYKGLIVFYTVILLLTSFSGIVTVTTDGHTSISGMELASSVFIFIAGIVSFKDVFKFGLANGLSRKTIFLSFVLSIVPFAGIMALVDTTIRLLASSIAKYSPLFMQTYGERYNNIATLGSYIEGFFWMVFFYSMVAGLGYLISLIYYRSNKMMKLVVSIAPPIFLFVVLPMISRFIPGGIFDPIVKFILFFFGRYNTINPLICMACSAITFIIFTSLSYLLIRRAPIKR